MSTTSNGLVSIPFIAGQWSLPIMVAGTPPDFACLNPLHCGAVVASGSARRMPTKTPRLNPLHCGAVVASHIVAEDPALSGVSQSPSLRGSGRFGRLSRWRTRRRRRLNPLHCGAVVASSSRHTGTAALLRGLNPLHCGAVVASPSNPPPRGKGGESQSPSLRGSGRFEQQQSRPCCAAPRVSIPFIAGQWSLPNLATCPLQIEDSLNPLHCGAVVASKRRRGGKPNGARSQSPSLRGSGRFSSPPPPSARHAASLNPLHCGAVVASCRMAGGRGLGVACLNPLHCGAVVASTAMRL